MNDTPTPDSLLWEALPDLTLTIAQTAALCSISVRQLGYWTQQGYVTASGQGARRTYGLDSVKRVLAIRKAMTAGASLRQSLRQVSSGQVSSGQVSSGQVSSGQVSSGPAVLRHSPTAVLESTLITHSLSAFFKANSCTRDHAGGLAVKLGWAEDDVRAAADSLCEAGVLVRTVCAGLPIFHSAVRENSHA